MEEKVPKKCFNVQYKGEYLFSKYFISKTFISFYCAELKVSGFKLIPFTKISVIHHVDVNKYTQNTDTLIYW